MGQPPLYQAVVLRHYELPDGSKAMLAAWQQDPRTLPATDSMLPQLDTMVREAVTACLSPMQAAHKVLDRANRSGWDIPTTLQHLPDELRLPFFLAHARQVDADPKTNALFADESLSAIPHHRETPEAGRAGSRGELRQAAYLVRQMQLKQGHRKDQANILERMRSFAAGLRDTSPLRYAMFTVIAANFDKLDRTKSDALRILQAGFSNPEVPPSDDSKLWRTDAVSGMVNTAVKDAGSNYTVKNVVNTWRDQMQKAGLTGEMCVKLTIDLIDTLPDMHTSLQAVTSRYNPQAKALKYIGQLLTGDLKDRGGQSIALTDVHRATIVLKLADKADQVDTSLRNPRRSTIGTARSMLSQGPVRRGAVAGAASGTVAGVASAVLAAGAATLSTVTAGAVVIPVAIGAALHYRHAQQPSNADRLRDIVRDSMTAQGLRAEKGRWSTAVRAAEYGHPGRTGRDPAGIPGPLRRIQACAPSIHDSAVQPPCGTCRRFFRQGALARIRHVEGCAAAPRLP